mmetsp:Transcript_7851/g.27432  ORF Transcript_7851/g.27432 Transcript_7851/m.27432 type:complete len:667 (-) Transcript_7851:588-2588(-)
MGYDGRLDCAVVLRPAPGAKLRVSSVALRLPLAVAKYAVGGGLGDDGEALANAQRLDWRWKNVPGADSRNPSGSPSVQGGWRLWVGDVDAGLFVKLKGADAAWDQAAGSKDLRFNPWAAGAGAGGYTATRRPGQRDNGPRASWAPAARVQKAAGVDLTAFVDDADYFASYLGADGSLAFNFSMLPTPVKGAYTSTRAAKREHYAEARHYHVPYGQWDPPAPVSVSFDPGANTLILHQSNSLNPYINWPFHPNVEPSVLEYVHAAAAAGVKVKMYYTIGQLSNHAVEFSALKNLAGAEVFTATPSQQPPPLGPGFGAAAPWRGMGDDLSGNEWLETHAVTGFRGGWFTMNPAGEQDAAVADDTTSRFVNYYLAGQGYLGTLGVRGLYYDGYDAPPAVQRRTRRADAGARYDVHGRAFQNAELLPYVDSMWTAEGVDYTKSADYWLVTLSALPFGVFGEMLGADATAPVPGKWCGQQCANKWRGMLFGMSNRCGWNGHDPNGNAGLWRLWDAFGIEEADLRGWWNETHRVVGTNSPDVLATAYVREDRRTLIALASWSGAAVSVELEIDWTALGLTPETASLTAPPLSSFNRATTATRFDTNAPACVVPPYQGWLLLLEPRRALLCWTAPPACQSVIKRVVCRPLVAARRRPGRTRAPWPAAALVARA